VFHLDVTINEPAGDWVGGSSLWIHAFTSANDPASPYVTARPRRGDVHTETARAQLQTWLGECKEHKSCTDPYQVVVLPARVIEVNPLGSEQPRIMESRGARGAYATLSYCWGPTPFPTLSTSSHAQFRDSLDMDQLPPTIRDAIITTRNLGLRYIWIDALCIIQDSEEDKLREIMRMKDIYAESAVTIVAATANRVSEGFLQPCHNPELAHTIPFRIDAKVFGTMTINDLDFECYDERFEPLSKRAWTLQEQFLAQRRVTFATPTMTWSCQAGTKNFADSLYFPHNLDNGFNGNDSKYTLNLESLLVSQEDTKSHKDKMLSCWLRLVSAYTLRHASLESEKLNVIAGIASHPSFSSKIGPGTWLDSGSIVFPASFYGGPRPDTERSKRARPSTFTALRDTEHPHGLGLVWMAAWFALTLHTMMMKNHQPSFVRFWSARQQQNIPT
jgi:hypothetical protein